MDIQEVNVDTIRDLKQRGKYSEAKELLAAFRKNVKDNTATYRNELIRQNVMKKKVKGICVLCSKPALEDKTLCQYHLDLKQKHAKKRHISERIKSKNKVKLKSDSDSVWERIEGKNKVKPKSDSDSVWERI